MKGVELLTTTLESVDPSLIEEREWGATLRQGTMWPKAADMHPLIELFTTLHLILSTHAMVKDSKRVSTILVIFLTYI